MVLGWIGWLYQWGLGVVGGRVGAVGGAASEWRGLRWSLSGGFVNVRRVGCGGFRVVGCVVGGSQALAPPVGGGAPCPSGHRFGAVTGIRWARCPVLTRLSGLRLFSNR